MPESAKNTAIAEKREENPEILTKLVRKRLTRFGPVPFPTVPRPLPNNAPEKSEETPAAGRKSRALTAHEPYLSGEV